MNIITDTNVWYDIASGLLDAGKIKGKGHRLLATPINFIEMSSLLTERTFIERKNAATAVLKYSAEILCDPETHLLKIWKLKNDILPFDWGNGFIAIAQASTILDFHTGVNDYQHQLVRKLNIDMAATWRKYHWEGFVKEMEKVLDFYITGYLKRREKGEIKFLPKEYWTKFEKSSIHRFSSKKHLVLHIIELY